MLQEVMHSHSISVVEEAVLEPSQQVALTPAGRHKYQQLEDVCDFFFFLFFFCAAHSLTPDPRLSIHPSCSSWLLGTDGS